MVVRDSSVGIATRYGLDGPGIEFRWGARFSAPVQTGPEAHPTSCTMGSGSFPGVQRPGRDVDHPPHLAPRSKKEQSYTSTPLWAFVACSRVKFTFTFIHVYIYIYIYSCVCKVILENKMLVQACNGIALPCFMCSKRS